MILVTGATGIVGRQTVAMLLGDGAQVAAVTRQGTTAALPTGAQVVTGDPSRPTTLIEALRGVDAVFLIPRAVGGATSELLALAAKQGVRRVVVVSALTVQYPAGYAHFANEFRATEDAARASGLEWTILRCADFDANSLAWAPQIRSSGIVRGAYGAAATSPIHERDIAAVGVRALLHFEHVGATYALTGPESLTQPDKVRLIGEAIGKELSWQEISPEQLRLGMLAQGLPA
ncbi:MAG: NAD(P)H-binding protein, partial [Candidatus Dormibacteraeota bacterium]|nr:NAD(P)H-binding protein [Candidatus Dormibacteraeota bacterium]